ncbi:MAG: hypothetical protein NZT92_06240 [Abditibacteriales bacterium]|nr:hypothetical protein [Abditibacteriales bacterium]MDW8364221.1 hypothetical protein [Abditibacteriales bacterium]
MHKQMSPPMIIGAIVVLVLFIAGLGWHFLFRRPPTLETPPPPFIDPATRKPRVGSQPTGSSPTGSAPMRRPPGFGGMSGSRR